MAKALTDKGIKGLKPGNTRLEIPDGQMPGLYLILQTTGTKTWVARYRFKGVSRKFTIGKYPTIALKDARELASAAITSAKAGVDPGEVKKADVIAAKEAEKDDVGSVVERFIDKYCKPNMKPRSADETARILRKNVVTAWAGKPISKVTKKDINDLLDSIIDRDAPIAANRVFSAVRKMMNWAVQRSLIEKSPAEGISPRTAERSRDRVLADDELRRVMMAADGLGWPFAPFLKVLALTGQRRDEVASMRWKELHLDDKLPVWILPKERSKNSVAHEIPLSPEVVSILKTLPRVQHEVNGRAVDSEFVFSTTGRTAISGFSRFKATLDAAILKSMREEASERGDDPDEVADLPDWRLHDLRRTMASGMARLGVQIHIVEKILNHVSGSFGGIVGVYQRHDFADEKRLALTAWARHVTGLTSGGIAKVVPFSKGRAHG